MDEIVQTTTDGLSAAIATAPAEASAGETVAVATEPQPVPAEQPQSGSMLGGFVPLILLFGIFYFILIRPQQRKEKERQKMVSELRAGRKVSFAGGLVGTIVEAKEQTFVIDCAGSKLEVARGAVAAALDESPAETTKK